MASAAIHNPVIIADDKESVRRLLHEVASKAGYEPYLAENGQVAVELTSKVRPSVILMDIKMPILDGVEAFQLIHKQYPEIPVILMTAYGTIDTAIQVMKMGAFDYLLKPSTVGEIRLTLDRAYQMRSMRDELTLLRGELREPIKIENKHRLGSVIGNSAAMQAVYKIVGRVAQTNATVLISGETGSGKEMIAKTIHNNSLRHDGPFIKVNCGGLPEPLMESELFGYEKGAFTGAANRKPGRFELAAHGTILLDEIGDVSPSTQVKLLRVLQEKEFEHLGGTETIKVDVRILAATNRDLEKLVEQGKFREDLYYRLNVVPIHVPPLREHLEDIPQLVDWFIRQFAEEAHLECPLITPEALKLLGEYSWPGNIRELANVIERAVILSQGVIDIHDLPGILPAHEKLLIALPETGDLRENLRRVEKQIIVNALKSQKGNRVKTAQYLHISRRALLYKVEEYGLGKKQDRADYKEIE